MLDCEDMVIVWAENQEWDDATLDQLKKEYNIFYERGTYLPVMLYKFSKKSGGMIVFGFEDDGALYFQKKDVINFEHQFKGTGGNSRLLVSEMRARSNSKIVHIEKLSRPTFCHAIVYPK